MLVKLFLKCNAFYSNSKNKSLLNRSLNEMIHKSLALGMNLSTYLALLLKNCGKACYSEFSIL